ncbi:MAG: hypothetical protein QM813_17145 [Verrucomicrobiota bacterium]
MVETRMNAVVKASEPLSPEIIGKLVLAGDLGGLTAAQQASFYVYRCEQAGLDPAATPFSILKLQGRTTLYANATCAQQLMKIHNLSAEIISREKMDGIYIVHTRVKSPDGRFSDNTGAVPIEGLKGDALANALMKASTKSLRRTVLAHVGLGLLDETEVATIPGASTVDYSADPRGDVSQVDHTLRDKHVAAVNEILNADAEELKIAEMLRGYVDEHLQKYQELFIAVADELQAQKIITKAQFKKYLKLGLVPEGSL